MKDELIQALRENILHMCALINISDKVAMKEHYQKEICKSQRRIDELERINLVPFNSSHLNSQAGL